MTAFDMSRGGGQVTLGGMSKDAPSSEIMGALGTKVPHVLAVQYGHLSQRLENQDLTIMAQAISTKEGQSLPSLPVIDHMAGVSFALPAPTPGGVDAAIAPPSNGHGGR